MTETKAPLTTRDRQLRRRVWLGVYGPVILGGLIALGLVVTVAIIGLREGNLGDDPASVAGDAAAIFVILQALIMLLIPLALAVGLAYLSFRLVRGIHPLLKRGQELTLRMAARTELTANSVAHTFIRVNSQRERWRVIKGYLRRSDV